MKNSDELYDLIHSLTKSEKRYFRLNAGMHERNGKSNYLLLFDVLEKQSEYDEEAVFRQFEGEKVLDNFASTKYQLTKLILKILRSYHDGASVDMRIRAYLDEIEILFHKGQIKLCFRLLKKVDALVSNYERFAMMLEVVDWRWKLIRRGKSTFTVEESEEKTKETQEHLAKLQEYVEYKTLSDRLTRITRVNPRMRTKEETEAMAEILRHPLLSSEYLPQNVLSQLAYYDIKGRASGANGDYETGFHHIMEAVKLQRKNSYLIEDDELDYIMSCNNLVAYALQSENLEVFKREIKILKGFNPRFLYNQLWLKSKALQLELAYLMNYADWKHGLEVIKEAEPWLNEADWGMSDASYLTYLHNITIFFFLQGEYSQALKWLNKILSNPRTESRRDIQDFSRIFQLIIHYELGNFDLLEYLFRSTYRYLKNKEKMHEFERMLIDFIRKSTRVVTKVELVNEFRLLKEKIDTHGKKITGKKPIAMQELLFYLESKIQGMPFKEYYEQKVREREEEHRAKKEKAG